MFVSESREEDHSLETSTPVPTSHVSPPDPQSPFSQPQQGRASHTHPNATRSKRWSNWKESVARRSQSVREFLRPRSLHASHPHHFHHHHYYHLRPHPHPHPSRHSYQDLTPRSRYRTGSDSESLPRSLTLSHSHYHTHTPHTSRCSYSSPKASWDYTVTFFSTKSYY